MKIYETYVTPGLITHSDKSEIQIPFDESIFEEEDMLLLPFYKNLVRIRKTNKLSCLLCRR